MSMTLTLFSELSTQYLFGFENLNLPAFITEIASPFCKSINGFEGAKMVWMIERNGRKKMKKKVSSSTSSSRYLAKATSEFKSLIGHAGKIQNHITSYLKINTPQTNTHNE